MGAVLTLALKDVRILARDRAALFWIVAFPVAYGIFFGLLNSGEAGASRMRIAAVDEDRSDGSRGFIANLNSSEAIDVRPMDAAAAREAVRRGRAIAYVRLKPGFGDSLGMFGGSEEGMEVGIDPARRAEAGYLQGLLMRASMQQLTGRITDRTGMSDWLRAGRESVASAEDIAPLQRSALLTMLNATDSYFAVASTELFGGTTGGNPMEPRLAVVEIASQRNGPRSPFEFTFPSAMMWAVIGCVSGFAVSLVQERTKGTFLRLQVSPLSLAQILAGKGVACALTCLVVITAIFLLGRILFGMRAENPLGLAMAIVCIAFGFTGLMMLFSVLGKTEQAVGGASMGFLLIMGMLGGAMLPLFMMPPWMQTGSHISPIKWGILALEGAIWRGFTLTDMLLPCGILIAIGLVAFALGVLRLLKADA